MSLIINSFPLRASKPPTSRVYHLLSHTQSLHSLSISYQVRSLFFDFNINTFCICFRFCLNPFVLAFKSEVFHFWSFCSSFCSLSSQESMATFELSGSVVSKSLTSYEGLGLRPSTVRVPSVGLCSVGLNQRCFRGLVVKAATVIAPKVFIL